MLIAFIGNDFVPHVPGLDTDVRVVVRNGVDVTETGIDLLFESYKRIMTDSDGTGNAWY